jgi:hypothetical protein
MGSGGGGEVEEGRRKIVGPTPDIRGLLRVLLAIISAIKKHFVAEGSRVESHNHISITLMYGGR